MGPWQVEAPEPRGRARFYSPRIRSHTNKFVWGTPFSISSFLLGGRIVWATRLTA